jgi:hypothetical protein
MTLDKIQQRERGTVNCYSTVDVYLSYVKGCTNTPIRYNIFKVLVKAYYAHILDRVFKGHTYDLPYYTGKVFVAKYRPTTLGSKLHKRKYNIDFNETRKQGFTVFYNHEETDGYKFRFYWVKSLQTIKNIDKYSLRLTSTNSEKLAKLIRGGQDYPVNK